MKFMIEVYAPSVYTVCTCLVWLGTIERARYAHIQLAASKINRIVMTYWIMSRIIGCVCPRTSNKDNQTMNGGSEREREKKKHRRDMIYALIKKFRLIRISSMDWWQWISIEFSSNHRNDDDNDNDTRYSNSNKCESICCRCKHNEQKRVLILMCVCIKYYSLILLRDFIVSTTYKLKYTVIFHKICIEQLHYKSFIFVLAHRFFIGNWVHGQNFLFSFAAFAYHMV